MQLSTLQRARCRPAIASVLTLAALAGCGGGSDSSDTTVAAPPAAAPAIEAVGPDGITDFTVVATLIDAPFFLTDDSRVGSLCGGDRGAGTAVDSSRVDLFREGDELIEGLTGVGVVDEILLSDDGQIASMTCSFGAVLDVSATDGDPYDLIFTSGRTTDAITLEMPAITTDTLTGTLALTR